MSSRVERTRTFLLRGTIVSGIGSLLLLPVVHVIGMEAAIGPLRAIAYLSAFTVLMIFLLSPGSSGGLLTRAIVSMSRIVPGAGREDAERTMKLVSNGSDTPRAARDRQRKRHEDRRSRGRRGRH